MIMISVHMSRQKRNTRIAQYNLNLAKTHQKNYHMVVMTLIRIKNIKLIVQSFHNAFCERIF
jgi:hypothetical protein